MRRDGAPEDVRAQGRPRCHPVRAARSWTTVPSRRASHVATTRASPQERRGVAAQSRVRETASLPR